MIAFTLPGLNIFRGGWGAWTKNRFFAVSCTLASLCVPTLWHLKWSPLLAWLCALTSFLVLECCHPSAGGGVVRAMECLPLSWLAPILQIPLLQQSCVRVPFSVFSSALLSFTMNFVMNLQTAICQEKRNKPRGPWQEHSRAKNNWWVSCEPARGPSPLPAHFSAFYLPPSHTQLVLQSSRGQTAPW